MSKATDRLDAEEFAHDAVNALYAFVDQADVAPTVMAPWVAGIEYMRLHAVLTEDNRPQRRLAYLWLLDAMIASPEAVTEALQTVRDRLVDTHEELQPYASEEEEAVTA